LVQNIENFRTLTQKFDHLPHSTVLDHQKALLAAIIENSQDAIVSKDLHSRITSWNKAAEKMFGYSEAEAVGELIHLIIPKERYHEEDEIISNLKAGRTVAHFETIRRRKDGKDVRVSLMISPIRDENGIIVGASKIARDITLQRLNEERLRVIHEVGKSISSHLDVDKILQIVTDATTKLSTAAFGAFFYNKIDSNGEAYMLYALCGARREDFEKFGMPRNTKVFQPTFSGAGIVRSDNILLDPRYGKNAPHHGMPKGHLPVVSYLAVPVSSHNGVVIGGLFFGHPEESRFTAEHEDIVSAVAAQAAIALDNAKLYQEINALNEKKDQYIGFASHELKTPLATLKGYLQLAISRKLPAEELYEKLQKQVTRLEDIVNELLDVSRMQSGKFDLRLQLVDLRDLVKHAAESIADLDRKIDLDLPNEKIEFVADPQKMGHVLANLLTNAAKYSDKDTPIKLVAMVLGDNLQISITDEGIGISKEQQPEIFNMYFRTAAAQAKAKGVGLGLYISKEIIQAHLGTIWVESEIGKGSTFHLTIPFSKTLPGADKDRGH
jgi:PAS domain S-box-containing protein